MSDKVLPDAYQEAKDFGTGVDKSFFNLDYLKKRLSVGLEIVTGGEKRTFTLEGDGTTETIKVTKLNGDTQEIAGVTWAQMEGLVNFAPVVNFIDNKVDDWRQGDA